MPGGAASLPGAALTLLLWLGGSALLRLVLGLSIGSASIYGPLAAPIAVLLWLYLINLALLVGAAFNASLDPGAPDRFISRSGHASQEVRYRFDRGPNLAEGEGVSSLRVLRHPGLPPGWRGRSDLTARRFVDLGRTKSMICPPRAC